LAWIEDALRRSQEEWKIAYFHHPLYSDGGRHGSNVELRVVLEPLLVRYGVAVVFSGHEHVYQRTTAQKGITYFVEGSSGQLRKGNMRPTAMTAASFDQDQTFMLVEIDGNELRFRTISRTGRVVDSGVIHRRLTT
jgi:3',5'-cyclic AMP phosphodiesterase CpdA